MRKLLKTILNAPTFTTHELYTIFMAKKLMAVKVTFSHALLANNEITGRKTSSAFITTAAIFKEIEQFADDLKTAWNLVQQQKTNKNKRKEFSADDAVPITAALVPDDMTDEELIKIKDYLKALHYTLQPLIAEQSISDSADSKFDYIIAQLEGVVTAKLPPELQGYPEYVEDDPELIEPLISAAPTLSADVTATIAILKARDEEENNTLDENKLIKTAKIQKAMLAELSLAYQQQREMTLAYRFNQEFKQYKTVLSTYIKERLETKNYNLYCGCFNRADYPGQAARGISPAHVDPIAKIAEVINRSDDQVLDAHEINIRNFAKQNLNFSRAIANYKLIHDAQTQLHPRHPSENEPQHLVLRLKGLYQDHADIDKNLQTVGDEAVDKATTGIRGFFKRIFSSINWYFSAAGKKDREFKAFAKSNREQFFKVTQTQAVVSDKSELRGPSPAA